MAPIDRRSAVTAFLAAGAASVIGPPARLSAADKISPEPQEAAIEPDLPIVDPHHHLWDHPLVPGSANYLLPQITADVSSGHNIRATVYIEAHSRYRTSGPEALRPVGETEFANQVGLANDRSPDAKRRICAGIVGHADLLLGAAVEDVLTAHIAAAPDRFRGIRYVLCPSPLEGQFADTKHVMRDPNFRAGLKIMAKHDLSFELMVFHFQLDDAVDLVHALPDVRFVLDHVGGPFGIGPYAGHADEVTRVWKAKIASIAKAPNVVCKLGGLGMFTTGFSWFAGGPRPTSDVLAATFKPYLDHAIACFGPDRCMFESNFPPDSATSHYVTLWNGFKKATKDYTAKERAHMFYDNAAAFYRL